MKTNVILNVIIIVVTFFVCANAVVAKPMGAKSMISRQAAFDFLAEKVVFCNSLDSLAAYKNRADVFDMDGLNSIVLAGECDFVPDGKFLALEDYSCHAINSTDVIAVAVQGITLWTFVSLVSRGNPDSQGFSAGLINMRISQDKQAKNYCP